MQIRLVAADSSADYLKRLSSVLSHSDAVQWSVTLYTDRQLFLRDFSGASCDILLLSAGMYDPSLRLSGTRLAVLLADPDQDGGFTAKGFQSIRKYQRISEIQRLILELYADVSPAESIYSGHSQAALLTAFYSPAGGVGATSAAIAYASRLAMAGKRTLYLDLQNISSHEAFFGPSDRKGVSELFAKLGSGINMAAKLQSLLQTDPATGLQHLNGFDNLVDFEAVTADDAAALLTVLRSSNMFDHIVADLSPYLNAAAMAVLTGADRIAAVKGTSTASRAKWALFEKQYSVYGAFREKLSAVLVGGGDTELPVLARLDFYTNASDSRSLCGFLAQNGSWDLTSLA